MYKADILCAERIQNSLSPDASDIIIKCRDEVTSTSTVLKENDDGKNRALIAMSQSAGRGRLGRSFFSPRDTGLYLSLRVNVSGLSPEKLMLITPAAAVAVCEAIEKFGCKPLGIKWVNDIILDSRKVCGILTEAVTLTNGDTGIIIGIGINMYQPDGGFPPEISSVAGHVFDKQRENLRNDIAADFINGFTKIIADIDNANFIDEYKKRSCVLGKQINVFRIGSEIPRTALAVDIDDRCRLLVRYDDGSSETLYSGEISIRTLK